MWPDPPTAMTTYCLPSLPEYVMGVASPVPSSSVDHNKVPFEESKARK
jgi:hypothetical protein